MSKSAELIASGFLPTKRFPAPGTIGSVAATAAWLLLHWSGIVRGAFGEGVACAVVIVAGLWATTAALRPESPDGADGGGAHRDPQWIVIDEWAGIFIACIGVNPGSFLHVGLAFILFRIFDISKIGPVGWAERLPAAWGIMADDVVAGICALGTQLILAYCLL